jgi:DNA polymerase
VVSIPSKEKDIAMMDIVTIDFETYYDQKFSLSKMTTEAYIRDPQFEIIGVGIKVNDYPTDWYAGDNVGKFLKSLDYSKRAILCHNTAFDGAILAWHFGINPRLWLDTLSMARPLHNLTVGGSLAALTTHYGLGKKGDEVVQALGKHKADFTAEELAKYGEYCINDVELTHALFNKLKVGFPSSELLVIDQTLRMYTEPVIELDVPLLEKHLEEVRTRKRMLLTDLGLTGVSEEALTKMLMSNEIFAKYLKNLGIDPPTKISARTGKEAWAFAKTDKGMTDLLEHPDERVQAVVTARLGTKSTIEETRTESLIGVAGRGRLPIMLNYYGAHTGRFSGGDKLNLQNLPSRGNTTIRRALKAPEGQLLVSCDSSQIEARTVAWVAGQDDLVQAFRDKRDVYSEFATEV